MEKPRSKISHLRQVIDQAGVTPEVEFWPYEGSGTEDDPYVVVWIDQDPRNPMNYSTAMKWTITMLNGLAALAVSFASSAYSGGARQIIAHFDISEEVFILGVSLFVLGFAIGPLIWAPLSELYGRQYLFIGTYLGITIFNAGACGSQNIETLLVLRFFAGAIGSSPLTNAGGVIADMFPVEQRGLALAIFAATPTLGPCLGPFIGGFVSETVGWRWMLGVITMFTAVLWIVGTLTLPETYQPVLLQKRARKLSQMTGKVYRTRQEISQGPKKPSSLFKVALSRPWILLFCEPIVLFLSIYMAIIYGTLYMCFAAFPIVYQESRGWSEGVGGLAFLGVAVGMLLSIIYSVWENNRYIKISKKYHGFAPPENRLPMTMVGGIAMVIGLFWFAWTNGPEIPWIVSIIAAAPFGFGMILIFLGIMSYLIDSYTIYAASVLAGNAVLRSLFGVTFPLFTTYMYDALGIHWATTVPAFLALACVPLPFLFYKYGPAIRKRCKYAAESAALMQQLQQGSAEGASDTDDARSRRSTKEDPTQDSEVKSTATDVLEDEVRTKNEMEV